MKKMINTEHLEGRVYQHDLTVKTVQNANSANYGKEFINGTLDIATDDNGLNVVPVHFTYVTEITKNGAKNQTYINLLKIINQNKTWVTVGKDEAICVKVDTALGLNDFYTADDRQVSQKMNEGGFVSIINEPSDNRATFTFDMVITSAETKEPENADPYMSLRGCVFNFRNDVLPMEVIVENPNGMKYFDNEEISNATPLFTKLWGHIVSNTETHIVTEDSAFGEAAVQSYERKVKRWVVTGTSKIPYDFGDEDVLTSDELIKGMQDREVRLAEIKKRQEDYQAQKNNVIKPSDITSFDTETPIKTATFDF